MPNQIYGLRLNGLSEAKDLKPTVARALVTGALLLSLILVLGGLSAAQPIQPPLPPVPFVDIESAIGIATGAGGTGVATFVSAEGVETWAALVVKAGTPDGIDRVTVTFSMETKTLSIEAEDGVPTNVVTVLVSKDFVATQVGSVEDHLSIEVSEAVNYLGPSVSEDAGGAEVYVFVITHFSTQTIRISPSALDGGVLLGGDGLTVTGWALIGAASAVIVVAAVAALRKRH